MYDGADTAYYLDSGYRVVAVDANPELVDKAKNKFAAQITSGQLTCINAAISASGEPVELTLSGPVPWHSDGRWRTYDETRSIITDVKLPGWNDIHANQE
jgi:predicted RNA methylase